MFPIAARRCERLGLQRCAQLMDILGRICKDAADLISHGAPLRTPPRTAGDIRTFKSSHFTANS